MTFRRVMVIAHRGASREAPENTLAAFEKAAEAGADAVELDVRLTADERLVVIHDERVKRTTGARGRVSRMTTREIRALDAGSWFGEEFAGERVPFLDEAAEFASGRLGLFVEVKDPGARRASVARLIHKALGAFRGEAVVMSFDAGFVAIYKGSYADARTALLTESPEGIIAAREVKADAVAVGLASPVSRLALPEAGRAGLGLYAWTVKSFRGFGHALRWDVDGVITNFPREARAAVDAIDAAAQRQFGGALSGKEEYLEWRRKFIRKMKRWPKAK